MAYEIDYIRVGDGEKGGDAITFRYGDFSSPSTQNVVVIDGGTKESGKALVEHIKRHYGTTHVDLVIASHLHNDHISGLTEVLEQLTIGGIVAHCPWDYTEAIQKMTNTSSTANKLETKLEKSFLVGIINPDESLIINIGKNGQFMFGLASIYANITPNDASKPISCFQKNPFTGDICKIKGENRFIDFFYIRSSNEDLQEKMNKWLVILTWVIAISALITIFPILF